MKAAKKKLIYQPTDVKFTDREIQKFWARVNKDGPMPDQTNPHYAGIGCCWEWKACKFRRGYGQFRAAGKNRKAHRASWIMEHGSLPEGTVVCHICDNTSCVRPSHLFAGSHQDNSDDMGAKGRTATGDRSGARTHPESRARGDEHYTRLRPHLLKRGADNFNTKLTEEIVANIRERYASGTTTLTALGEQYGVSAASICTIVNGTTWTHVPLSPGPKLPLWATQHSKVTAEQVIEIRSRGVKGLNARRILGSEFGLSEITIWKILTRKTWKHITP